MILSDHYNSQGNYNIVSTMKSIKLKPTNFSNIKYINSKQQDERLNNKSVR